VTSWAGRLGRPLLGALVLVVVLVLWELWARNKASFLVPTASDTLERAWDTWRTRAFLEDVAASMKRLAIGFGIGAGVGIALGLVMGSWQWSRRALEPLVELLRATPPIAVVPVLLVVLGIGQSTLIAVIAFGVCFPVLVNTFQGVRAVSPEARDTASMLHVGRVERVLRIHFPAALPSIMAGLRIALSISLVMVVISEFTAGADDGLGHYILELQGGFAIPEMYATMLFLGLLGLALNRLFLLVERRILAWHYGAVGARSG
jgi:ABC-type nitrate/sulfonate/bicarbonate transport system permease component